MSLQRHLRDLFAASSGCCKNLCLYSLYLQEISSLALSVDMSVVGETLRYLDAYQFLRAGGDILCFLTPVSEQRCAFLPPFSL